MSYTIECAYISHIGRIRANNEDNFWCMGDYLEAEHFSSDIKTIMVQQSEIPVFAVFDGMGGEANGEIASYIAAKVWDQCYNQYKQGGHNHGLDNLLQDACAKMNQAVSDYAEAEKTNTMGTTVALVGFGDEDIYICNVGDSKIYQRFGKNINAISTDHVANSGTGSKGALTQYIGMKKEEIPLVPALAKGTYHKDDDFLICSDGLSDMVDEREILKILSLKVSAKEIVARLLDKALVNGGVDNITIILCRVKKQRY